MVEKLSISLRTNILRCLSDNFSARRLIISYSSPSSVSVSARCQDLPAECRIRCHLGHCNHNCVVQDPLPHRPLPTSVYRTVLCAFTGFLRSGSRTCTSFIGRPGQGRSLATHGPRPGESPLADWQGDRDAVPSIEFRQQLYNLRSGENLIGPTEEASIRLPDLPEGCVLGISVESLGSFAWSART